MRRREFLAGVGGAAWAFPGSAQQSRKRMRRIGFLSGASQASAAPILAVLAGFPDGMRELGSPTSKAGISSSTGASPRLGTSGSPTSLMEMVRLNVDVILLATPAAVPAVQRADQTIPIVMGYSTDPVGNGFVASLARPGGNTTVLACLVEDIIVKQLELLRGGSTAMLPASACCPILENPSSGPMLRTAEGSARSHACRSAAARRPDFGGHRSRPSRPLSTEGIGAVMVASDALFHTHSHKAGGTRFARALGVDVCPM